MHAILGLLLIATALGALARLARQGPVAPDGAAEPRGRGEAASHARTAPAAHAAAMGSSGASGAGSGRLVAQVGSGQARRQGLDRVRGADSRYRRGPWPGLTGRGAGVLGVCGVMLLGGELVVGRVERAWPDLVWLAVLACVPPLVGTCIVRAPGCASAVCGVYLLGRSLASLVLPGVELPPLLLPAAVACDVVVWLRGADVRRGGRSRWRRAKRTQRSLTTWRVVLGGAAFGGVLALVEPPFAVLLGSDPLGWSAGQGSLAGGAAVLACALAGVSIEAITNRLRAPQETG